MKGRSAVAPLVVGVALGALLSRLGFTRYGELHAMWTFRDLRLLLVFAGAVAISLIAYRLAGERADAASTTSTNRSIGVVVGGGVLFGLGWVVSGACPGVVFAQLGEGRLIALPTLVGLIVGVRLAAHVQRRARAAPSTSSASDGSSTASSTGALVVSSCS